MIRLLVILLLWLLQVLLVLLLTTSGWIERQMQAEQAVTAAQLGEARYAKLREAAEHDYAGWFVQSGAVDFSYTRLLPDKKAVHKNDPDVAPWFFTWFEQRLDALWWLVYQAVYRLQLMGVWAFYLGALAAAAFMEGMVRWRIKRETHEPPRNDRYIVGWHLLLILAAAPPAYLFLPITVHPLAVPLWGCAFALSIVLFGANLQHRV